MAEDDDAKEKDESKGSAETPDIVSEPEKKTEEPEVIKEAKPVENAEIVETAEPLTETKSEPITQTEPCDPLTMTCDEMQDKIIDLAGQSQSYKDTIKKLEEVNEVMPSEELTKELGKAINKKKTIDDEMKDTFIKYTICSDEEKEN